MVENVFKRLDAWIFDAYPARVADLAVYRIVYATYLLLVYVPTGAWFHSAPQAFFRPPAGLPALFTSFPSSSMITAFNVVLALAGCLLLVGLYTRIASVAISVLLLTLNSWIFSVGGKIDHDILFVICPLVLALSGWGDALSLDSVHAPRRSENTWQGSWGLSLLALLIGLAMFQAGLAKTTSGWLDPRTHSTYGHLVANVYATGRHTWAADHFLYAGPLLMEIADWSAVALEMGFGLAFLRRDLMFVFLAFACLFHLGVWLLFDIGFATNVIVYAAFLPYATYLQHVRVLTGLTRPWSTWPRLAGWLTFVAALVLALSAVKSGRVVVSLIHAPVVLVVLVGGAFVGAGYLTARTFHLVTRFRSHHHS